MAVAVRGSTSNEIMSSFPPHLRPQWEELESTCNELDTIDSIQDAKTMLKQLFVAMSGDRLSKPQKAHYMAKLKEFEKVIHDAERKVLFADGTKTSGDTLIGASSTVEQLEQKNVERLQQALQQLHESEDIAEDTLSRLAQQKETMKGTLEHLKQVDSGLNESNSLLNRMSKWWRK